MSAHHKVDLLASSLGQSSLKLPVVPLVHFIHNYDGHIKYFYDSIFLILILSITFFCVKAPRIEKGGGKKCESAHLTS